MQFSLCSRTNRQILVRRWHGAGLQSRPHIHAFGLRTICEQFANHSVCSCIQGLRLGLNVAIFSTNIWGQFHSGQRLSFYTRYKLRFFPLISTDDRKSISIFETEFRSSLQNVDTAPLGLFHFTPKIYEHYCSFMWTNSAHSTKLSGEKVGTERMDK